MFLLLLLGIGLAVLLTLAYGALRASPWSPRDGGALAWARLHGFVTAVIATVAVLTAALGLGTLRQTELPNTHSESVRPGAEAIELPVTNLDTGAVLLAAAAPGLWLLVVYAVAQRTWPRATGPVRRARLQARRATSLLPPVLTPVVAGIGVASLAAIALAWTAPGAAPLHLQYSAGTSTMESSSAGVHPGTELAPWLLLTLVILVTVAAAVTVLVARRPSLSGLTPDEDLAIRRIAVHRALRTAGAAALVVLVVAVAGWAEGTVQVATREAYGSLDAMAAAYAEGVTFDGDGGAHLEVTGHPPTDLPMGFDAVRYSAPVAALLGVVVLLLWRPSGFRCTDGS